MDTQNSHSPIRISVVIPARNSGKTLFACLASIQSSTVPVHEIVVVSDGSTDNTCAIAKEFGVSLIELNDHHQANYCRNLGAAEAGGDLLMFLDSDVVLGCDAVRNTLRSMEAGTPDAIVGVYSLRHRHANEASQYKNLWIRYSYLRKRQFVDWIFGAIAIIRRDVFEAAGGFDDTLFMHTGGDLELGKRMANGQPLIFLDPTVEVEHLKQHTLRTLLKNDFKRSQGFVRLAARLGQLRHSFTRGFVNVYPAFAYSSLLAWFVLLFLALGIWSVTSFWIGVAALVCYTAINMPFMIYYTQVRGFMKVPAAFGIMLLDHLVCGLGCLKGIVRWLFT